MNARTKRMEMEKLEGILEKLKRDASSGRLRSESLQQLTKNLSVATIPYEIDARCAKAIPLFSVGPLVTKLNRVFKAQHRSAK